MMEKGSKGSQTFDLHRPVQSRLLLVCLLIIGSTSVPFGFSLFGTILLDIQGIDLIDYGLMYLGTILGTGVRHSHVG